MCNGSGSESGNCSQWGRVFSTQFHPRKVAAIDTAPKGRMERDRSATVVLLKARIRSARASVTPLKYTRRDLKTGSVIFSADV